jgi:hypothetical protein
VDARPGFSEANEEWKNEFYLAPDNLPHDDFALFEWKGNQYVANISDKWTASSTRARSARPSRS